MLLDNYRNNMKSLSYAATEEVIVLTSQMLDIARLEDWQKLTEFDNKRRAALERLFSQSAELNPEIINALEQILEVNYLITNICKLARQKVVEQVQVADKGRVATNKYVSTKLQFP